VAVMVMLVVAFILVAVVMQKFVEESAGRARGAVGRCDRGRFFVMVGNRRGLSTFGGR